MYIIFIGHHDKEGKVQFDGPYIYILRDCQESRYSNPQKKNT